MTPNRWLLLALTITILLFIMWPRQNTEVTSKFGVQMKNTDRINELTRSYLATPAIAVVVPSSWAEAYARIEPFERDMITAELFRSSQYETYRDRVHTACRKLAAAVPPIANSGPERQSEYNAKVACNHAGYLDTRLEISRGE